MPRPRFRNLEPAKQRAILDAAAHEFAENGFEGASYNRIIAAAGVSKGAMYYYFDDKEDLYATVIEAVFEEFLGRVGEFPDVTSAGEYWSVFRDVMRRSIATWRDDPRSADLSRSFQLMRKSGELGPALQRVMRKGAEWATHVLRKGQDVGAVRDDLPFDLLLLVTMELDGVMDGWLAEHWDDLDASEREAMLEKTFDLFRRIARPDDGARDDAQRTGGGDS